MHGNISCLHIRAIIANRIDGCSVDAHGKNIVDGNHAEHKIGRTESDRLDICGTEFL